MPAKGEVVVELVEEEVEVEVEDGISLLALLTIAFKWL